jgi:predicted CoA-binding protein
VFKLNYSGMEVMLPSKTILPSEVLNKAKVVAVVGASKNPEKEAHKVPLYLKEHGYNIIPVNPTSDYVIGEKAYSSLIDIPNEIATKIEVIDVFRPSEELADIASQTIELAKRVGKKYVFWAQLGLENEKAKEMLRKEGFEYIMNSCMMAEHKLIHK